MTERISELLNMLRDESNCNVLDYVDEAADLIESLAAELEQVKRERDAAVKDLRKVCKATEVCFCCENYDATLAEYVSNDCMDCIKHCNWKWRGVNEG